MVKNSFCLKSLYFIIFLCKFISCFLVFFLTSAILFEEEVSIFFTYNASAHSIIMIYYICTMQIPLSSYCIFKMINSLLPPPPPMKKKKKPTTPPTFTPLKGIEGRRLIAPEDATSSLPMTSELGAARVRSPGSGSTVCSGGLLPVCSSPSSTGVWDPRYSFNGMARINPQGEN